MELRGLILPGVLLLGSFTACVQTPRLPPKTQLQMRELQSRTYEGKDVKLVMRAVIGALQDDGFLIRNADKELGFINALKEVDVSDADQAFWLRIFVGPDATYEKNSIVEASANVAEFGREVRVRVVFQAKVLNNFGNPVRSDTVGDPVFYRDFFSRVDKSLFIERQGL